MAASNTIPTFKPKFTHTMNGNGSEWVDTEPLVREMRTWLADTLAEMDPSKETVTVSFRHHAKMWDFDKSPVMPKPRTMREYPLNVIAVHEVDALSREQKTLVTLFAHKTGAEVRFNQHGSMYMFYPEHF